MSLYIEKVKKNLDQKIDTYFKDKDFGYSDIYSLIRYIEDNLGFDLKTQMNDDLLIRVKAICDEMYTDKNFYNLSPIHLQNYTNVINVSDFNVYNDTDITFLVQKLELLNDSIGKFTFMERSAICMLCLNEIEDELKLAKAFVFYGFKGYSRNPKYETVRNLAERGKKILQKLLYCNVFLPICDYLLSNIDEKHQMKILLERYKFRTEHYSKIDLGLKIKDDSKLEEKVFQPDLALYLLDQGFFKFTKESNSVNSNRIDFLGDDFIIEVKQIDLKDDIQTKKPKFDGACQLLNYLDSENRKTGFLVIFIHGKNPEYENKRFDVVNKLIKRSDKEIHVFLIDLRLRDASDVIINQVSEASKINSIINIEVKIDEDTLKINIPKIL